jgi:DNA-binding FadR family transcriptional regulator
MPTFVPLQRRSLANQIQSQLRQAVADGRYGVGDALPSERELANLFGASRVAVREALLTLQTQGLINRAHGRTARVSEVKALPSMNAEGITLPIQASDGNVRDVKQARMLLEVEMVRLAALSMTPEGKIILLKALQLNRDAISNGPVFFATDMALHTAIASLSGNALFISMTSEMLSWLTRFRRDVVHLEGLNMLSFREHAGIVDRIVERDANGAVQAMSDHLSRSHMAYDRLHSVQSLQIQDSKIPIEKKSRKIIRV